MSDEPEPIRDVAHLGHVELLTPRPEESLHFFHDVLGMEETTRAGQSVFLRGCGDYERHTLKLTEAEQAGIGHIAWRAVSPAALARRAAAVEAAGCGMGWIEGDIGHGPAYRFSDPDGHRMELYYEAEHYRPPAHLQPALKNQPQRYTGRGAGAATRPRQRPLRRGDAEPRLHGGAARLPRARAGHPRRRH